MSDQDRIKINQAIEKITKEANSHEGKPAYKRILRFSEIVAESIRTGADADAVLKDGKTLAGADKAVSEAARKDGGCIADDEAHGLVLEYFGLTVRDASPAVSVIDVGDLI